MSTVTSTSIEAYAGHVASGEQATREDTVVELFRQNPNSTDREVAVLAGNKDSNWGRPARRHAVRNGRMRKSGERTCTVSGEMASTWEVVPAGEKVKPKKSNKTLLMESRGVIGAFRDLHTGSIPMTSLPQLLERANEIVSEINEALDG